MLKAKKQKFDVPQVTPLMKGDCVCESPCNEYCSNKKQISVSEIIDEIIEEVRKSIANNSKTLNIAENAKINVQPINTKPKQE